MKAAVISLGSVSSKWTFEAMQKYFEEVDMIDIRDLEVDLGNKDADVLLKGKKMQSYDCIYLKGSFRYLQILSALASCLEGKTYMPIKSDAFIKGHDKLLTHLVLQNAGVAMPETFIAANAAGAKLLLEKLNYPIVMKFPSGTQGKGVMFADSFVSASSMLDALQALNQPVIIQNYIETGGKDIRAIVVGDKVIAAMERKAVEGEKRANIHAGGKGQKVVLDAKTKKLAVDTAKALGADVCAVDILQSAKASLVIEANLSPGLQGITEATGIKVADKIAEYLYGKAKEFQGSAGHVKNKIARATGLSDEATTIVDNAKVTKNKLIIPELITNAAEFCDDDEILLAAEKNTIVITKSKKIR